MEREGQNDLKVQKWIKGEKKKKKIPTEGGGFLRAIKTRSTTSFGGEVKPSVPCRRFTACKRTFGHE
jgi:hypothetical protein